MKRTLQIAAIATVVSCLAACGSSDNNTSLASSTPPATTTPPAGSGTGTVTAMIDSFTQYVMSMIGMTSETTQPVSIDAVVVTQPETTQPVAVSQ